MIYKVFKHKNSGMYGNIDVYVSDNETLIELYESKIPSLFENITQVEHWVNKDDYKIVEVEITEIK